MATQPTTATTARETLPALQVYGMAAICLAAGLAIGYLLRGTESPAAGAHPVAGAVPLTVPGGAPGGQAMPGSAAGSGPQAQPAGGEGGRSPHTGGMSGGGRMPSLGEMQQMADKQAALLKEKLKSDPKNTAVLMQLGAIYYTTHQFKEASAYYGRAVKADPGNVAFRTKFATGLYQSGDVDGAIAELNKALSYDPKDANALFNLGMIRLQGKKDGKGALAAWQQLLKRNPQLSADRKAEVQKLMADVMTSLAQSQK